MSPGTTEDLIQELVADAAPVRRIPSLRAAGIGVAALWLVVVGGVGFVSGLRSGLQSALATPLYAGVFFGLLLAAVSAVAAGLASAVPGRERLATAGLGVSLASLVLTLVAAAAHMVFVSAGEVPLVADAACLAKAVGFSVVPGAGLLAYLLAGWVADPLKAAGMAVAGAAALGGVAVHLVCSFDGARHLLLGHVSAPVVLTLALAVPLAIVLRRWAR